MLASPPGIYHTSNAPFYRLVVSGKMSGLSKQDILALVLILVVVSSFLLRDYLAFLPGYYFKKINVYVLTLVFISQVITRVDYTVRLSYLILGTLFAGSQVLALYCSSCGDTGGFGYQMTSWVLFFGVIFLHYLVLKNFYRQLGARFIPCFYAGIIVLGCVLIAVNLVQLGYLHAPRFFDKPVQFISDHLVLQWFESDRFYRVANSYVKSCHRLNGLYEEASENVAILFLCILPFVMGRIQAAREFVIPVRKYAFDLLVMILVFWIFVCAQASSALVFLGTALLVICWIVFKNSSIASWPFFILGVATGLLAACWYNGEMLYAYLVKMGDFTSVSTRSRVGMTIGLFSLFADHPVFGVGKGMISASLFEHIPLWARTFEIDMWQAKEGFPVLSSFFGFLAEYGLVGFVFVLFVLYQTYVGLRESASGNLLYRQVFYSYRIFLAFLAVAVQMQVMWYKSCVLVCLFFFVSMGLSAHKGFWLEKNSLYPYQSA
jgi:hypothetical protein